MHAHLTPVCSAEKLLQKAVFGLLNKKNESSIDFLKIALRADTNKDGKNKPSMRPVFVWYQMSFLDGSENFPYLPWILWWRQRWNDSPHYPIFDTSEEKSWRKIVVDLAHLDCLEKISDSDSRFLNVSHTIGELLENKCLSWVSFIELCTSLSIGEALTKDDPVWFGPLPTFYISDPHWRIFWTVLITLHPTHEDSFSRLTVLANNPKEFAQLVNDYLATRTPTYLSSRVILPALVVA